MRCVAMGLVQWVDRLRSNFSYDDAMLESEYSYDDYDELEYDDIESTAYSDDSLVYGSDDDSEIDGDEIQSINTYSLQRDNSAIDSNSQSINSAQHTYYSAHGDDREQMFDDVEEFDQDDYAPYSGRYDGDIVNDESFSDTEISLIKNKLPNKMKEFNSRIKLNDEKINDYKNKMRLEEVEKMSYDEQKPQMVYDLNKDIRIESNSLAMLEINLRNFEDVKEICAAVKSGNGIVCYMAGVEAQIANQFICYLNGFCSALNAQMNKIAEATFILTPRQVRYIKAEEREMYNRNSMSDYRNRSAI